MLPLLALNQRNDSILAKSKDHDGKKEQLQERDRQLTQMRSELQAIKTALEREKEKTKQLWPMKCEKYR
jgi:hypothetical protein